MQAKERAALQSARLWLFFNHSHPILFVFLSCMSFSAPAEQLSRSRHVNIKRWFPLKNKSALAAGRGNGPIWSTTSCFCSTVTDLYFSHGCLASRTDVCFAWHLFSFSTNNTITVTHILNFHPDKIFSLSRLLLHFLLNATHACIQAHFQFSVAPF